MEARIAIAPTATNKAFAGDEESIRQRIEMMSNIVRDAGASIVSVNKANGLIWLAIDDGSELATLLGANPQIEWVQLPWAGVETFAASGIFTRPVKFTCAKAAYAGQVGEHALTLILAMLRNLVEQSRTKYWHETEPDSLEGKRVTILGGGGIARSLIRYLQAANCDITVLRRKDEPVAGATRTLPISSLHSVLPDTDILVLALSLTSETQNIIDAPAFAALPPHAILVNVARGGHVDTAALVDALKNGKLQAAGLDVINPEPLPADHPLWSMNNVLITSHCADGTEYRTAMLSKRIRDNVIRFQQGEELIGVVDPSKGY